MASGDLTTLSTLKEWLGITATTDDALLTRLVTAASAFIQNYLNRTFYVSAIVETRDGTGTNRLFLARGPVLSVSSVSIDGISVPESTSTSMYGWVAGTNVITLRGGVFPLNVVNVQVTYSAGYVTVPSDIEQVCVDLCSMRYKERDRIGYVSKSLGGETVTFSVKDFSSWAQTTINQYKKSVPL